MIIIPGLLLTRTRAVTTEGGCVVTKYLISLLFLKKVERVLLLKILKISHTTCQEEKSGCLVPKMEIMIH